MVRDCGVLGEGLRGVSIEKSELYIPYQKVFILAISRINLDNQTHFLIHSHNLITIFNGILGYIVYKSAILVRLPNFLKDSRSRFDESKRGS